MEEAGFETQVCGARGLEGLSAVLAHLYRFLLPPRPPFFGLRLAGFAAVEASRVLDRWSPAPDLPVGTTWIGRRAGAGESGGPC